MTPIVELLAKVAGEHRMAGLNGYCRCGWAPECREGDRIAQHDAHLAAVQAAALAPWVAQREAEALREAADEITDSRNRGAQHDHRTAAHIDQWLRACADRIAPTTEEQP